MATIASENLLKAILELNENGEEVIAARLSEFLRISSAAVSMALKRLQKKGHVRISNKRSIHLTPEGFRTASVLVRRHRLAERLLTDILHMPWEKVHDEAEKLEHAISPELEKRMLELFGERGTCPHGSPFTPALPSKRGSRCFPLAEASENTRLRVVRIAELYEKEKDFLNSLAAVRLLPGSHLTLLRKTFDGILELRVGDRKTAFSTESGSRIWVENV
ncbi:MAG: metal-dependent transcriptional regulator [Acidobacteria bacterium]|nr:metal-dependent transcriptional regulator [Acidobacteriota bacterium]MCZ6753345.1 metal-dependent transcriptional regulator [Acidobacteriota bacterium]